MNYDKIKDSIEDLSKEELINLMLLFAKASANKSIHGTKDAIILALKNGIFEADSHKSLGYESMAIAFGLAFIQTHEATLIRNDKLPLEGQGSIMQQNEQWYDIQELINQLNQNQIIE